MTPETFNDMVSERSMLSSRKSWCHEEVFTKRNMARPGPDCQRMYTFLASFRFETKSTRHSSVHTSSPSLDGEKVLGTGSRTVEQEQAKLELLEI